MSRMSLAPPALARLLSIAFLAGLLLAGGCVTVGPDYARPAIPTPPQWSAELTGGLVATAPPPETLSQWWTLLNDPVLSDLMVQARSHNLDVRQAEARLRQSRAQRAAAQADGLPTLAASASASRAHSREMNGRSTTSDLFTNGLDASWELDLFGRNRRALESADATLQASQEDLNAVLVSLFAEIALNYVDVRSLQLRLGLAEASLATRAGTCDLTQWRHEAGLTTQLDVDQARASLEQARAEMPTLRTALEQAKHRLAVLLGQPPGTLQELLAKPAAIPVPPVALAVGVPADVLRQRPDVRRAERRLAAQTAQIGVATAARYPSFSLVGSIGLESLAWSGLYASGARTAQAAANATWTLFDAGRVRSGIQLQTALQEEALCLYEATVLAALEEVENALVAYANEQARRRALAAAAQAGESAFALARDQYASGLVDFQTVLDVQRSLLTTQDQLAASDGSIVSDLIRLYKALGGGWTPLAPHLATATAKPSGDTP